MSDLNQKDDHEYTRPWLPWFVALGEPGIMAKRKGWRTVRCNRPYTNPSHTKAKHFTWVETRFESPNSEWWQMIKRVKMSCPVDSTDAEAEGRANSIRWGDNVYFDDVAVGREGGETSCDSRSEKIGNGEGGEGAGGVEGVGDKTVE